MPPIRIAPGTFAGGTRFMDIAVPMAAQALAGMFQGKRLGEQETYERQQKAEEIKRQQDALQRKQAVDSLAALIEIHGPDAVKMPEFQSNYKQVFGRDYPTVPIMETQEVSPAVPGTPEVPAQDVYIPSVTSPAEMGPGGVRRGTLGGPQTVTIPGQEAVPGKPAVTREVQTGTRPVPLGGATQRGPTLGSLGLFPPGHPMSQLSIPEAKAIGLDVDKLLFPTAVTKEQAIGRLITKAAQGQATPQELAVLDMVIGSPDQQPRTMQELMVQQLRAVNYDVSRLPPPLQQEWQRMQEQGNKDNTIEGIRTKIAKYGLASLTEGERTLYYESIARSPDKYSWEDYKLDIVQGRMPMPTDPDARRVLLGRDPAAGGVSDTEVRQARFKAAAAEAEFARIKAEVTQGYMQARPGTPLMTATWKETLRKLDAAAANARYWREYATQFGAPTGPAGSSIPSGGPTAGPVSNTQPDAMSWARQSYNDAIGNFQRQQGRKPTLKEFMDAVQRMQWPKGSEAYRDALINMAKKTLK